MIFSFFRCWIFLVTVLSIVSTQVVAKPTCANSDIASVHCGLVPSAFSDANKIWVTFVQGRSVWLTTSSDIGRTFSKPVRVNHLEHDIYSNGENRPKIFVRKNRVYISWTEKTSGRYTGNIRFARSEDGGKTFFPSVKVNDDDLLTSHRFDAMHVTDDGRIYLAWLDKRDKEAASEKGEDYPGSALYFSVSGDGGKTFEANKKVADYSCECCRLALDSAGEFAPPGSDVVVLWRQIFSGGARDHALVTLGRNGATDEVRRATVDEWKIDACPHHGPDIATSPSGYHMAWFSDGEINQGLYHGLFGSEKNSNVTRMDGGAGASHPRILVIGTTVYYLWKVFDGEKTTVKMKTSEDNGRAWSHEEPIAETAGASDHPLLFESGDGAMLSWRTDNEGFRVFELRQKPDPVVDLHHFDATSFAKIQEKYQGRTYLISLWSTACAPCFKELEMLGKWRAKNPNVPLVLIATDAREETEEVVRILRRYNLATTENWIFADPFVEKLRYSIDAEWRGELPRTYLIDPESTQVVKGLLEEDILDAWRSD